MNPRHPPTECCAYAQAAADYEKINADHTNLGGFDRHIRLRRERASQFARDSLCWRKTDSNPSVPPQKTAFFRDRPQSGDDKPAR
jgi:hypothetical protein